jgi:hypothetical protein
MQYLSVPKRTIDLSQWRRRKAALSDCARFVEEDTVVEVDGKPVLAYWHRLDKDFSVLRAALGRIRYIEAFRAAKEAMFTRARTFGYAPRLPLRNQPCRKTSLAADQPLEHSVLVDAARIAHDCYKTAFPEQAAKHAEISAKVLPEYRIADTPFTSGIVNQNNPLPYHFDRGNFKSVNSAMLGFKNEIEGGHLTVPEIDTAFAIGDQSLLLFDGQSLLHGVTPFRRLSDSAARYTVVFYSLEGMWRCEPPGEEVKAFNRARTANERRRAAKGKTE